MLKNIVVKVAIVVMSLLIVKPVAAADSKTIKEDSKILQPLCVWFVCPPVDPIDPVIPGIRR
ncbi:hypothetical protein [Rheinheimera pleomorphica]|uniref:hypothetical protein n=1 Tax=Rheinheimera pleomorphica TaxID=2703963 RepID=UPI0014229B70|nr:hypothetical protein [Rheinheimera pleomorphica]